MQGLSSRPGEDAVVRVGGAYLFFFWALYDCFLLHLELTILSSVKTGFKFFFAYRGAKERFFSPVTCSMGLQK